MFGWADLIQIVIIVWLMWGFDRSFIQNTQWEIVVR